MNAALLRDDLGNGTPHALELGIGEVNVKAHGGRVMRKMRVESPAELVRPDAGT